MFQNIEFITFLLKSTNQHGVHSPFVYDLVTQCFYDKTNYDAYAKLANYRKALLSNKKTIAVTDFGSGSRVFSSNTRTIHKMAKTSGTPLKRAKLLYRIINYVQPKHTLELGTSLGIATHAMALCSAENTVTSIEGCLQTSAIAQQQLSHFNIKNATLKTGAFDVILPELTHNKYDLVFFDGNHSKKATLGYFNCLLDSSHNESIFIFDDIHWSKGMRQAWDVIKDHPKVTVTIDTFFWGFVFFRKEQAKENFIIRV